MAKIPVRRWGIWDAREKKFVGKPYSNKRRAHTRVDKLDNEYGAYRYQVKELEGALAKGGRIVDWTKLRRGPRVHTAMEEAIRKGDMEEAYARLEELKEILEMSDEELSRLLGKSFVAPKGKLTRLYAEGGKAKKDRPALDLLKAIGRSMAGAIPGTGEEAQLVGEDVGRRIYELGQYPVAGFKTQWWGINPMTGEAEYAGPSIPKGVPEELWLYDPELAMRMTTAIQEEREKKSKETRAIPGIIDETAALPLFAELLTGGLYEAPEFAQTAGERVMDLEQQLFKQMEMEDPEGIVENALYSAGIMGGQLPVPVKAPTKSKGLLAAVPRAGLEFLSPIIEPRIANYLTGAVFGGSLMTGFEQIEDPTEVEMLADEVRAGNGEAAEQLVALAKAGDTTAVEMVNDLIQTIQAQRGREQAEAEGVYPFAKGGKIQKLVRWLYAPADDIDSTIEDLIEEGFPEDLLEELEFKESKFIGPDTDLDYAVRIEGSPQAVKAIDELELGRTEEGLEEYLKDPYIGPQLIADPQDMSLEEIEEVLKSRREKPEQHAKGGKILDLTERMARRRGMYKPDLEIPEGFTRFEVRETSSGKSGTIIGIREDGTSKKLGTSTLELANALARLYNAGGYSDTLLERVPLQPTKKAKGGKLSRRDILKGLGAVGVTAAGAGKAGRHADVLPTLKQIEESIDVPIAAKAAAKGSLHSTPFRTVGAHIRQQIKDVIEEGDTELADMFQEDLKQYEKVAQLMDEGKLERAAKVYDQQDTAAREYLYDFLDEDELREAKKTLGVGKSDWESANIVDHPDFDDIVLEAQSVFDTKGEKALQNFMSDLEKQGWDVDDLSDFLE